jgi:hypothetical protein
MPIFFENIRKIRGHLKLYREVDIFCGWDLLCATKKPWSRVVLFKIAIKIVNPIRKLDFKPTAICNVESTRSLDHGS